MAQSACAVKGTLANTPQSAQAVKLPSSLVDAVLGHCWCLEDGDVGPGWERDLEIDRALCEMLS